METSIITAFILVLTLNAAAPAQEMQQDEIPPLQYEYGGLNPDDFFDDENAPEPDPEFTIRPNVPYTRVRNPNGTATVRFTGATRVTIRPPRLVVPVPGYNRTPRTSYNPAGWQFTGPDTNNNWIPDDLENENVDVAVAPELLGPP